MSSRAAEGQFACRQYKKDLSDHVSAFLAAVKASLVQLGVDENKLHRIVEEVSTCCSFTYPHLASQAMLN